MTIFTVNFFYPPGEHDDHYFIHWAKEICNCETGKCCSDGRVLCCSQDHCADQCSHCSSVWQSGCDVPAVSADHSHSCRNKFSGTIVIYMMLYDSAQQSHIIQHYIFSFVQYGLQWLTNLGVRVKLDLYIYIHGILQMTLFRATYGSAFKYLSVNIF